MRIEKTPTSRPRAGRVTDGSGELPLVSLSAEALDDRIAIVGTAGSGKTYAAKGFVERLLESGARVTIVDPLGVWWGLRASADGTSGYPVVDEIDGEPGPRRRRRLDRGPSRSAGRQAHSRRSAAAAAWRRLCV